MVVTNSYDLYETVKNLRVHGSKPKYFRKRVGGNFRLDTIQAAVMNVFDLKKFENLTRQEYIQALSSVY